MTIIKQFYRKNGIVERELNASETSIELLAEYQKDKDIINNLPSWKIVVDTINKANNLDDMKVIVGKLARIVYWIAKNQKD